MGRWWHEARVTSVVDCVNQGRQTKGESHSRFLHFFRPFFFSWVESCFMARRIRVLGGQNSFDKALSSHDHATLPVENNGTWCMAEYFGASTCWLDTIKLPH